MAKVDPTNIFPPVLKKYHRKEIKTIKIAPKKDAPLTKVSFNSIQT
jgi:hypothetical protein